MNKWIFLVLLCISNKLSSQYRNDLSQILKTYFDPISKNALRVTSIENMVTINSTKLQSIIKPSLKFNNIRKFAFRSNGCACQGVTCGCCLGINLTQFNFNREGCMNFTYDPYDFSVTTMMTMNENTVFFNVFSAKNPPPLCLPVVIPYIPISIDTCAKIYNVHTSGQNLNMCFDFETRIEKATLLVLHFDCIRMGSNGVALVKPDDTGEVIVSEEHEEESDIYDEVTEIKYKQ